MILYHGSNVAVQEPKILIPVRSLDFGAGFYTTSDEKQAVKCAKLQTFRRKTGIATVTSYDYDEATARNLLFLQFKSADGDWLNYIVQNRKGLYSGIKYDIVAGSVANDSTITVINDYMAGNIDENTALVLLKPQKLSDQYAFLTWRGLKVLRFREGKQYE